MQSHARSDPGHVSLIVSDELSYRIAVCLTRARDLVFQVEAETFRRRRLGGCGFIVRRGEAPEGPRDVEGIKQMYDLGLRVTLNTDDPAEFNSGFMNQTLMGAVKGSGYTKKGLVNLMRNAFDGSWLPREKKDAYIKQLHEYTG